MYLNLPIIDMLDTSKNILIAGMGGGYDVFSGLPIYFELKRRGKDVHLANFSFTDIVGVEGGENLTDTLVGVSTDCDIHDDYFPEYFLSEWFYEELNEDIIIWCFQKTGLRPLLKNYQTLIKHLNIDAIILVDGGVDSLMHGDEPELGTLFEDALSLCAVNKLTQVPTRITACLGMGVEWEVGYAHVFENIAGLAKSDDFLGSCSLIKQMEVYGKYKDAVMHTFSQQTRRSVICASVVSAVEGEYGNYHLLKRTEGSILHISPLMGIYWFFDLEGVAKQNKILSSLEKTYDVDEAWRSMKSACDRLPKRNTPVYPLP